MFCERDEIWLAARNVSVEDRIFRTFFFFLPRLFSRRNMVLRPGPRLVVFRIFTDILELEIRRRTMNKVQVEENDG